MPIVIASGAVNPLLLKTLTPFNRGRNRSQNFRRLRTRSRVRGSRKVLDLKVTNLFFDRATVIKAVDAGRRKALNRIGGFLRTTAKRSIRKRKGTSAPGQPPSSHVGLLRDHIYYSYDPVSQSVVIGPALITSNHKTATPINATVPQVLEYGGRVLRRKNNRTIQTVVAPRPFMGPAMQTARKADKLEQAWKDVI